ncbi:MAG: BsaA family SipW-dependent biofilm matrix protein [Bacilli bacterium]|nr:BsaA family SipW-dependent biofilm matrix protein [Bacilli bacterium]
MEEHERKHNNKKTIIAIILLAVIGVVGGTLAYFTSQAQFTNVFRTKPYSTELTEEFDAPDNWLPGEETSKKVYVTNKGDVPVAVRISYTEEWVGGNGTTKLDLVQTKEDGTKVTAALINFPNSDDWISKTESDGNTYYYYNNALGRDEQTSLFIDKVTFNKDIDIAYTCENVYTYADGTSSTGSQPEEGKTLKSTTQKCNSTDETYAGATYTLTIKIETVQFDAFQTYWNTNIDIPNA